MDSQLLVCEASFYFSIAVVPRISPLARSSSNFFLVSSSKALISAMDIPYHLSNQQNTCRNEALDNISRIVRKYLSVKVCEQPFLCGVYECLHLVLEPPPLELDADELVAGHHWVSRGLVRKKINTMLFSLNLTIQSPFKGPLPVFSETKLAGSSSFLKSAALTGSLAMSIGTTVLSFNFFLSSS